MASNNNITVTFSGNASSLTAALANIGNSLNRTQQQANTFSNSMSKIGSALKSGFAGAVAAVAVKEVAGSFYEVTKAYDSMKAALTASVGAENTDAVFKSLQQFAKETPFSLEEVTSSYQRMVTLGLNPSKEAMMAYGNIAAANNKQMSQYLEAVADAMTGENERLKEFGITASKSGKMITYSYQGVPTTFEATAENIEKYTMEVAKSVAGGKALEEQAKSIGGRMSALGDTIQQFQYNLMESTWAAQTLGSVIDTLTNFVSDMNDIFNSGAASIYFDAFMAKSKPLIDVLKQLWQWLKDLFPPDFGKEANSTISDFYDDIMSFIDLMKNFFAMGGLDSILDIAAIALLKIPHSINEVVDKSLAHLRYFKEQAINILSAIGTAISNGSIAAGKEAYDKASAQSKKDLENNLKDIDTDYKRTGKLLDDMSKNAYDNLNNIGKKTDENTKKNKENTQSLMDNAKAKLDNYKAEEKAKAGKPAAFETVGKKLSDEVKAKRAAAAGSGAGSDKKGKGGASSASNEASKEYKKMLDNMLAAEEDMYKRGEVSAKQHFNKVLQLKLEQLNSEQAATSKNIEENNKNIARSTTSEKDKKKLTNDNLKLQNQMNKMTEEEKGLREEIARQLRDAEQQYKDNILNLKTELDGLAGTESWKTAMQNFEQQYRDLRKRIQAEDTESGDNNFALFEKLESLTKATAQIKQSNAELDKQEAQNTALRAELEYKVAAGLISQSTANKTLLNQNEALKQARVDYYENELKIAEATDGFNQKEIAAIKEKLYLAKTAALQLDSVKEVQDSVGESLTTLFTDFANGADSAGDAMKNFGKTILNTINGIIAQNLSKQLMSSLFGGVDSSGNGGTGALSSVGGWITKGLGSLLSSSFATGGIMRPNSLNLVGEHGPELIKTGATSDRVFNRAKTNSILNSQDGMRAGNVNVYVTAKDANSFNQSKSQIQQNVSRELSKSYNRNS